MRRSSGRTSPQLLLLMVVGRGWTVPQMRCGRQCGWSQAGGSSAARGAFNLFSVLRRKSSHDPTILIANGPCADAARWRSQIMNVPLHPACTERFSTPWPRINPSFFLLPPRCFRCAYCIGCGSQQTFRGCLGLGNAPMVGSAERWRPDEVPIVTSRLSPPRLI